MQEDGKATLLKWRGSLTTLLFKVKSLSRKVGQQIILHLWDFQLKMKCFNCSQRFLLFSIFSFFSPLSRKNCSQRWNGVRHWLVTVPGRLKVSHSKAFCFQGKRWGCSRERWKIPQPWANLRKQILSLCVYLAFSEWKLLRFSNSQSNRCTQTFLKWAKLCYLYNNRPTPRLLKTVLSASPRPSRTA